MSEETKISEQPTIVIDGNLAERIREEIGENVYLCYQCVKCTSGCPVCGIFRLAAKPDHAGCPVGPGRYRIYIQKPPGYVPPV